MAEHEGIFERVSEDTLERCVKMVRGMAIINRYKAHLSDEELDIWFERFLDGSATPEQMARETISE